MNFFTTVPVAFINAATPLERGLIVFCATTLATLTIIGVLAYVLFRKIPEAGLLAPFERLSRRIRDFFVVGITGGGAYLLAVFFKNYYMIIRPSVYNLSLHALLTETDYGFPSGHATTFAALATALFFIDRRAGYVGAAIALIIGIARILSGVHTPMDVLGGYLLGILFACIVSFVAEAVSSEPSSNTQ